VETLPNKPPKYNFEMVIRSMEHGRGEFNMPLRWKGRLEIENRRYVLELFAENESVLTRLLPGLSAAWSAHSVKADGARIYGKDGVVHDPRTGIISNCIKDIWKVRLDDFLEGWRRTRV
jgi:hypothetical protein